MKDLGPAAATLQPIFITIDPERDTPALLKEYLANFGGDIAGLSGTAAEIAAVAKSYGVYYAKRPTDNGDYTMDHSTALYLVEPDGKLVRLLDVEVDPAKLAGELRVAIAGEKEAAAPATPLATDAGIPLDHHRLDGH
jgi:protein SCO1/2